MESKKFFPNKRKNIALFLKNNDIGSISFSLGTFFLLSALPISVLFYLISIFKSFSLKKSYLNCKYNLVLIFISGIMLFSTFNAVNNFNYINFIDPNKNNIIWLGLTNWIPLFILFITSQEYLRTSYQRRTFSIILISGSIPLLISCALQYWFSIYGPFNFFHGLIIWFQKPITNSGITGLFNNQNYTGLWLTALLPFVISEFLRNNKIIKNKIFLSFLIFLMIYFTFLTTSRNALIGILISILFYFRYKSIFLTPLTIISIYLINLFNQLIFNSDTSKEYFILELLFNKFTSISQIDLSRIEIYIIAKDLIYKNPMYGIGSSIFPYFYQAEGGIWEAQHSHNILLEIALNFGIPTSIFLTCFIVTLLIKSFIKLKPISIKYRFFITEKSFLVSAIIILVSHIFDITYYDGRISILSWLLFSGLKCIIDDKKIILHTNKLPQK